MDREEAIKKHSELMHKYGVFCGPNKDYLPDGMLYYENEDTGVSFMEITPYDPIKIVPLLEVELANKFGESCDE